MEKVGSERDTAVRVAGRVLAGIDELVARMGAAYRANVPEYAALGEEEMATEVLPVSRAVVDTFFRAVAEGRDPATAEVPQLDRMGRRRLEMGVPLEPMLHVYRLAGRTVWDAVVEAVPPGEERVLGDLGAAWIDYIDRVSSVAAGSYLDASHERLRRIDARRGALLDALLAAGDASDVAAVGVEFATSFAAVYVPVLVAGDRVATRIDRLTALCPPGTISGFRSGHVVLLVPDQPPELHALLGEVEAATVAHGVAAAPGAALTAELGHTDGLLRLATAVRRTGVVGPADLLGEQLVAGNPRAAAVLAQQVLAPLRGADRHGQLESTLRAYLACGSVPATARAEVVHANTVTYRLGRVAEVTGLDPRVPAQAALLVLALAIPTGG